MRKYFIFFLIIIGLTMIFSACSTCVEKKKYDSKNFKISITRTQCFGKCPDYTLEVFGDGSMSYVGRANVEMIGEHVNTVGAEVIERLADEVEKSGFFDMKDEYVERITDLPTTYLMINLNGKTKRIKDYYGAPKALKDLESGIDELIKTSGWKKK